MAVLIAGPVSAEARVGAPPRISHAGCTLDEMGAEKIESNTASDCSHLCCGAHARGGKGRAGAASVAIGQTLNSLHGA
eukprot:930675-Pleurochrysis_carterae.AAC.1